MKIETQHTKNFKPFNVTISIESPADLAAMLSLTNQSVATVVDEFNTTFGDSFKGVDERDVRDVAQGSLYRLWYVFNEAAKEYIAQP